MKLIPWGEPALRAVEDYGSKVPPKLRGDVVSLDSETTGFNPYTGARAFCYTMFSNKGEKLYFPKTPRTTQYVMDFLGDRDKVAVLQNGKYDFNILTFEGWSIKDLRAEYHDTLAMGVLLDEFGAHDLGYMVKRWLGVDSGIKEGPSEWCAEQDKQNAKVHRKTECGRGWPDKEDHVPCACGMRRMNYSDVPGEIMVPYAEWDAEHTLKLAYFFKTPIKRDFWELYQTERDLILCTIEMEQRGVMMDMDRVRKLRRQAEADLGWIEEQLTDTVGREFIIKGTGSKKDLFEVITEDLGWDIQRTTKKGNPQFDEFGMLSYLDPALAHVVREHADTMTARDYIQKFRDEAKRVGAPKAQLFVPLMLKWRELEKMVNTYYRPFEAQAIPVETATRSASLAVLHAKFNSLTAITGRFSSSNPNLQNIPRILGPRQCFRPRPGFIQYHFDYMQVELVLYIHYAKDEKLLAALLAGEDLHLQTATEIFDKSKDQVSKEERKRAKSTNFGVLYGSGAETLAETLTKMGIPTTEGQARLLLEKFHRARPSMRRLMSKCKAELMRRGYVQNEFGRRFRVPLKLSYKAINALIQGCSADIMKRAMVRIWRFLKKHKLRSRLIMTIHDEIILEVHESEEDFVVPRVKRLMELDAPMFWAPVKVDVERTWTYWSEKHSKTRDCFAKDCGRCDGRWTAGTYEAKCTCKCHKKEGAAA